MIDRSHGERIESLLLRVGDAFFLRHYVGNEVKRLFLRHRVNVADLVLVADSVEFVGDVH